MPKIMLKLFSPSYMYMYIVTSNNFYHFMFIDEHSHICWSDTSQCTLYSLQFVVITASNSIRLQSGFRLAPKILFLNFLNMYKISTCVSETVDSNGLGSTLYM